MHSMHPDRFAQELAHVCTRVHKHDRDILTAPANIMPMVIACGTKKAIQHSEAQHRLQLQGEQEVACANSLR